MTSSFNSTCLPHTLQDNYVYVVVACSIIAFNIECVVTDISNLFYTVLHIVLSSHARNTRRANVSTTIEIFNAAL